MRLTASSGGLLGRGVMVWARQTVRICTDPISSAGPTSIGFVSQFIDHRDADEKQHRADPTHRIGNLLRKVGAKRLTSIPKAR
jgi:hypothetical protein